MTDRIDQRKKLCGLVDEPELLKLEGTQAERRAIVAENGRRIRKAKLAEIVPARSSRNEHIDAAPNYWDIETSPSSKGYGSDVEIKNVELKIAGTYHRVAICLTLEGEEARQSCGGEMIPGPFAGTYGLASCIAASRIARKPSIEVTDGDVICIPHSHGESAYTYYRVRIFRREYVALDRIEADGSLTPSDGSF